MAIGPVFYPPSLNQVPPEANRPEGRLLIVGEEMPQRRALHTNLYSLGFDIGEAGSGEEALELCRISHFDAVLVDAGMFGRNGIRTCAELRHLLPRGAILVLSVNDDRERQVEALEAGADHYVTRPFHLRELTARIRATLRAALAAGVQTEEAVVVGEVVGEVVGDAVGEIVVGEMSLDPVRRLARKAGCRIRLTPREFSLLRCLMTQPGMPVARGRLLRVLWGREYPALVDCLRTLVLRLRRKIEDDPSVPLYILTENHIGYRFVDPADWKQGIHSCSRGPAVVSRRSSGK
jgi:two-component system KDP operon response regulator KdpE